MLGLSKNIFYKLIKWIMSHKNRIDCASIETSSCRMEIFVFHFIFFFDKFFSDLIFQLLIWPITVCVSGLPKLFLCFIRIVCFVFHEINKFGLINPLKFNRLDLMNWLDLLNWRLPVKRFSSATFSIFFFIFIFLIWFTRTFR